MKFPCDICKKGFYPHELYLIDEYGICEECRERVIKEYKQENEKAEYWQEIKNLPIFKT